ncbi:hypothetical protein MRX96_049556 [Rhipicephalus microplus]
MANCRFKHVCFILQIAVIAGCPDVLMHGPSSDTLRRLLPRFSGDRTDGHVQSSTGRESAAADRVQDFPPVDVISINHLYCSRHGTVAALAARMPKDIRAAMWNHHFSGSGGGMANCRFKHVCFILQIAVIAGCPDVLMHGPSSDTLRRLLPRFSGDRTDGHVQSSTGRESAAADRVQDFPPVDVISINHLYCSRHGTVAALAARMPKDIRAAMWNHHFSGSGGGMANCRFKHVCFILQIVGVLASHPLDHRSLPAVEIPFCGSTSAYVDVICAATDSSCVFESAAPSLLNSATACPFHEPRSTTSVTSSRLIVDGLKAHATCHPASGHGCTDRMKNLRHIFLVVQIVGVLASHPLDHRSLPAVEIPFCGSTSAYVDVICAATDSSCVFESAAPSLLNSATACPFHEPRSTTVRCLCSGGSAQR